MLNNKQLAYLDWVKSYNPALYQAARKVRVQMLGNSAVSPTPASEPDSTWENLMALLTVGAQTGMSVYQQDQLYKLNLQRIQMGLKPIDYAPNQAAVNVGVSDETKKWVSYLVIGSLIILGSAVFLPRIRAN